MRNHFRDTAFGHLVRLLSGNRLLKYPDEINPTVWKQCIQKRSAAPASTSEEHNDRAGSNNQTAIDTSDGGEGQVQKPILEKGDINQSSTNHDSAEEVFLVNWYGPDDQENPQNWPETRKLLVTFQICILNFAVYMGSAIYTPGETGVMEEFSVNDVTATLGLSLFVLGYGLGPMLFSPMSEMPTIGRSRIYFWTLFAFVVLQVPTGYAVDITMLLIFRFLTGFLGGPVLSTGGATISDMFPPAKASYWLCVWGAFGIMSPVLGPIIGGFAAEAEGWRWTIWELTWLCSVVLIILFFLMPETNPDNILYRRAQRLRKATGQPRLKSQSEIDAAEFLIKNHLVVLGRAFTLIVLEPIVFILDLYCALLYGILYVWFESFPLVFEGIYGFNTGQQGLVFLGIFVGALLTLPFHLLWIRWYMAPRFTKPDFKPEMILPPTFFGSIALPICLFWYGWTSNQNIHWIVPIVGSGFFSVSIVTLFSPVITYLGMNYPEYAASVYAGNALFRALFGVVFPLFARALFEKLGVGAGNSLLGGLSTLFIPLPFLFFYYGERIRNWNKNA